MHPVEASNKGGFAAPRRTDERRRMIRRDVQVDVLQGVIRPVPRVQILN